MQQESHEFEMLFIVPGRWSVRFVIIPVIFLTGGLILWEQQVRMRHMITRKYLKITKDGKIHLEDDNADPLTVFRLHPVIRERDEIEYETYCRIEHVVTGRWISTTQGTQALVV